MSFIFKQILNLNFYFRFQQQSWDFCHILRNVRLLDFFSFQLLGNFKEVMSQSVDCSSENSVFALFIWFSWQCCIFSRKLYQATEKKQQETSALLLGSHNQLHGCLAVLFCRKVRLHQIEYRSPDQHPPGR